MHKLLIVDDDEYNRDVLTDALDNEDYELTMAENGQVALEQIGICKPDIVLLDINMPIMDGVETLKHIKSNDNTKDIPVIMVTALNTDSQIAACLDAGAIDHIVKPFSRMVVRARVRSALRQSDEAQLQTNQNNTTTGKVYTFLGVKGGVGTTTLAVNVATELTTRGKRTVLCELMKQCGSVSAQLDSVSTSNLSSLINKNDQSFSKKMVEKNICTLPNGLRLLLSPQKTEGIQEITNEQSESILMRLSQTADFTIVDVPSTMNETTAVAFRRSDQVIMVLEMEPSSLKAASQMLERIHNLGISNSNIGAVLTNRAQLTSPLPLNTIRSELECKLIGIVPPDPDGFMSAAKKNIPLILSMPNSSSAGSIASIVNRLSSDQIKTMEF